MKGSFPTATFVLTSSISVGTPAEGQTVTQKATGNLTLHGVTRPVEISVENHGTMEFQLVFAKGGA